MGKSGDAKKKLPSRFAHHILGDGCQKSAASRWPVISAFWAIHKSMVFVGGIPIVLAVGTDKSQSSRGSRTSQRIQKGFGIPAMGVGSFQPISHSHLVGFPMEFRRGAIPASPHDKRFPLQSTVEPKTPNW